MDDNITAMSPSDIKIFKLDFNEDSDDLLCDQSTHPPSIKKSRIKNSNFFKEYSDLFKFRT